MANTINFGKIYEITWWGNAIDTAPSIGDKIDFFGSQFAADQRQEVEAVKCLADWIHTTALKDLNS
jgi:hypothetical protein